MAKSKERIKIEKELEIIIDLIEHLDADRDLIEEKLYKLDIEKNILIKMISKEVIIKDE